MVPFPLCCVVSTVKRLYMYIHYIREQERLTMTHFFDDFGCGWSGISSSQTTGLRLKKGQSGTQSWKIERHIITLLHTASNVLYDL